MIIDKELADKIERCYPMPIAIPYQRAREGQLKDLTTQFKHALDLFEAIFKFLTSLTIRAYLVTGGMEPKINEYLMGFRGTPLDGKWIELLRECLKSFHNKQQGIKDSSEIINGGHELLSKLSSFYLNKIHEGRDNPVFKIAKKLVTENNKLSKNIIREPNISSLFDLIQVIRNKIFTHEKVQNYQNLVDNIFYILNYILKELSFLEDYPLYSIDEVKVRQGIYVHDANRCMGTNFDPQQMKLKNVSINNDELYLFKMKPKNDSLDQVNWALSLSPYLIVAHCNDCGQKRIFVFASWAKNVIEYKSTGCTHTFIPDVKYKEFDDIRSFLEGKISLKGLFRGKTLGTEIQEELIGATPKLFYKAKGLLKTAHDKLLNKENVLAQKDLEEAVKINPDFGEAYFSLAMCLILQKRDVKTICRYLDKAVAIDPHNLKFLIATAKIYMTIEKDKEAACALQKALDADPSHQEARALFTHLKHGNNDPE